MTEPDKAEISYAGPTTRRIKSQAKTIAAPIAFIFVVLAGLSAFALSNDWLLYGQDNVRLFLFFAVPACLIIATVLAVAARRMSDHPSGLLALAACVAGWLMVVAFIGFVIANFKPG